MTTPPSPDIRALPAAVSDDRGKAVLALATQVSASFDWRAGLALTSADIPTVMLPHAIRSLAVQNYVEPGMKEVYQRRVVENALTIKVQEGTIRGVRYALGLLGMTVQWTQWHKQTPMGPPGTHRVTLQINERLFEGEPLLSDRQQAHALKVIDTVKRLSQDVAFSLEAAGASDIGVAAVAMQPMQIAFVTGEAA